MTPDLRQIADVSPLVRSGAISPVTLVEQCLAQIDARPELNAFITRLDAQALSEAKSAEQSIRNGRYLGPLHGIPVSVKDLDRRCGNNRRRRARRDRRSTRRNDAPAVTRLQRRRRRHHRQDEPARVRLRHDERGDRVRRRSATRTTRHAPPAARAAGRRPRVAAGMCFGALGTDTGGSIRIPSAACGIGRPQADRRRDLVRGCRAAEHVARSSRADGAQRHGRRAALRRARLNGRRHVVAAAEGPLTLRRPSARISATGSRPESRLAFERARDALAAAGHTVRDLTIDHAALDAPTSICTSSCRRRRSITRNFLERIRRALFAGRPRPAGNGPLSPRRRLRARDAPAAGAGDRRRSGARRAAMRCLLPTLPIPAPPLGAATVDINGTAEPVRAAMLRLTQLFNITGHPSLALPAPHGVDSLPRSVQIVGRRHHHGTTAADRASRRAVPVDRRRTEVSIVLSGVFHAWERRLASVSTDRVVRPFEWGLEWVDRPVRNGGQQRRRHLEAVGRPDGCVERASSLPCRPRRLQARRRLARRIRAPCETPHAENNLVRARYFPDMSPRGPQACRDRAAAVERRRRRATSACAGC